MPQLVQILLPLTTDEGTRFPQAAYAQVSAELTQRFGGLTAFTRAPAEGVWRDGESRESHDEIVVFEVMCEDLDGPWWSEYRRELEVRFQQDAIVIRAHETRLL